MPQVVGVRFKTAGKIYHFTPGNIPDLQVGDYVVVETSRGYETGQVVIAPHEACNGEVTKQLKPVVRRATVADLLSKERYAMREAEALKRCREKVAEYGLPMKVVGAEYSFDGSSLVFFFTAEKRVDFRDLVRDLARIFRARIELRQIGVRDEAKLIGGIGPCGCPLCCITYLAEFEPVSIKMAKEQNLPLSPMEISGLCGRLLCCLAYENDYYREAKQNLPKEKEIVSTEYGKGKVLEVNVIKQTVTVELESGVTVEVPWPGQQTEEVEVVEEAREKVQEVEKEQKQEETTRAEPKEERPPRRRKRPRRRRSRRSSEGAD